MNKEHLSELIAIEQTYWWHIGKKKLLMELLSRHCFAGATIIEGGIGSSNNLVTLKKLGYKVHGIDILPEAVRHCQMLGIDDVYMHDLQTPWPVEFGKFDAVILLDVIEHSKYPERILRNAKRSLRLGGKIFLTVPAMPSLMGPWDKELGHYRRYTIKILQNDAAAAGLKINWHSHWNAFILLPAAIVRLLEQFFDVPHKAKFPRVPQFLNETLIGLLSLELKLMNKIKIPFGLSLVAILS